MYVHISWNDKHTIGSVDRSLLRQNIYIFQSVNRQFMHLTNFHVNVQFQ